ncbi:MAG: GGDEF domain-containing protein [Treponema sp.]|nr:GGDEF domain-containing protein [Treponema sp.]
MKRKIAVLTSGWAVDYLQDVLRGIRKACENKNIDIYVFCAFKFSEPDGSDNVTGFAIYDLINYKDYDGIIIMPNLFNDEARVEYERKRIVESGVPAVSLNQKLDGLHFINSDNHDVYKNLINHLIDVHYLTDFAYIGGPAGNPGADSNFSAFKEALESHGLTVNEDNLYLNGDWSYDFAYEQAKKIFKDNQHFPQAVVCVNDWAAMAVATVAFENNISVPEEVAVVGFDDIYFSSRVIPSISTVDMCGDIMGEEAVKLLLRAPNEYTEKIIRAKEYFRQSCGCISDIRMIQKHYSLCHSQEIDSMQRFASQLRHLEDVFIRYVSPEELVQKVQNYFVKRHTFEGSDFAILLKKKVVKTLLYSTEKLEESKTFDGDMQVIINIQDGQSAKQGAYLKKYNLVPNNLLSDESTIFLLMPIFNQRYLHGYYVSKNYLNLLNNKSAYNWTRNFGSAIEKFRQTSNYRLLGEQFKILSTKDGLSGLLNRNGMETYAIPLFNKNNQDGNKTLIIFVDINRMKIINDRFGHLHGDLAVKTVAETIQSSIPNGFLAIRYGGDEFVIVGTCTKLEDEMFLCDEIKNGLAKRTLSMSLPYELTASIGAKLFEANEAASLNDAIQAVDEIMYKNKNKYHRAEKHNERKNGEKS